MDNIRDFVFPRQILRPKRKKKVKNKASNDGYKAKNQYHLLYGMVGIKLTMMLGNKVKNQYHLFPYVYQKSTYKSKRM